MSSQCVIDLPPFGTFGVGHKLRLAIVSRLGRTFAPGDELWFVPCPVLGVGNDEDSLSSVLGIEGTSRKCDRPDGVAESFQVRKTIVELKRDDPRHILAKHPSGPRFGNNANHFRPEEAVIFLASALPGLGKWLARESSGNKVN